MGFWDRWGCGACGEFGRAARDERHERVAQQPGVRPARHDEGVRRAHPEYALAALDNYEASIATGGDPHTPQHIVIQTKNKKYFKRIALPDAARLGFRLDPSRLTPSHALNTLLVTYEKPPEVRSKIIKI